MTYGAALFDEVVSWFPDPKPNGTGTMCTCPNHSDDKRSLHISPGKNGGAVLKCHAGCETVDVLARVGKTFKDIMPPREEPSSSGKKIIGTTAYSYEDRDGALRFQSVRKQFDDGSKEFYLRQPRPGGGWNNTIKGVELLPFRLPQLIAAVEAGEYILLLEGEKDVLRAEKEGFWATTNATGAGKWQESYTDLLVEIGVVDLVLIPDNDLPGFKHMLQIYRSFQAKGKADGIQIVQLNGIPEKGDLSDWLDAAGVMDDFDRLLAGNRMIGARVIDVAELARLAGEGDQQEEPSTSDETGSVDLWPDRLELPGARSVPTMTPEMIPPALATWLTDIAETVKIPLEMVTAPAIVGIGSIIGRHIGIKPWKFTNFVTVPNPWGLVVSRPGWMKSFAVGEALKPIGRLATAERENFEARRDQAEADIAALQAQLKDIKRRMDEAAKDGKTLDKLKEEFAAKTKASRDAKVVERRFMTHDATVEKLAELLRDNPRGMLVVRDEVYGLLRSFEKSGRENDRQFYLEAWSGTGAFTHDRIARGTIHVPSLTVSIIGGIQPGRVRTLSDEAVGGGGGDDGLLQRFQIMVYPDRLEPWEKPTKYPDKEARDRVFEIFEWLNNCIPSDLLATSDFAGDIPYLEFTPFAQNVADAWHEELERRLRSSEFDNSPAFASHLAKYRSLMPELALIFHLVSVASKTAPAGPVTEGPTRLAAAWCEFLELHARKIYDIELDRGAAAARAIAKKIKEGAIIDAQTVREIYRNQWSGLKSDEVVIDGLAVLADLNWVRLESISNGGRASQIVRLHPDLRAGGGQ